MVYSFNKMSLRDKNFPKFCRKHERGHNSVLNSVILLKFKPVRILKHMNINYKFESVDDNGQWTVTDHDSSL